MKKADVLPYVMGLGFLLVLISFNACGDEEPTNLDRDKFIGEYIGNFMCPVALSLISADSVSFSIDVGVDKDVKESVIVFLPVEGQPAPLSITATVSGNNITFADTQEDVPVAQLDDFLTDIVVSGEGRLTDDKLTGTINIIMFVANSQTDVIGDDTCTLEGVKQ